MAGKFSYGTSSHTQPYTIDFINPDCHLLGKKTTWVVGGVGGRRGAVFIFSISPVIFSVAMSANTYPNVFFQRVELKKSVGIHIIFCKFDF